MLDIRRWRRERLMQPGQRFNWVWGQQDALTLGVAVHVEEHQVVLAYRNRQDDGSLTLMECPVALDWAPCPFGGRRSWFRCPTEGCERRAAILYLEDHRFACRHCLNLAYPTQRQNPVDRNLYRAGKIGSQLDAVEKPGASPSKPKGMRWRTYERLLMDAELAQFRAMRAVLDKIGGVDEYGMCFTRSELTDKGA